MVSLKKTVLYLACALGQIVPVAGQATAAAQTQETKKIDWLSGYNNAVAQAMKEQLPIYISFTGPDWCSYCKIMEEKIYASPDFIEATSHKFVFLQLLLPRSRQPSTEVQDLMHRFGITGVPTTVILSSDGKNELARFGYTRLSPKEYADHILAVQMHK